jgi:pimeloyl-ACP methyl ester carboxylesterase
MPPARRDAVAGRMTKVSAEFAALFADPVPACAYAALTMPVRLLRGDASPLPARGVASRLNELLPCATLVTLRGGVHMQPVSDPCSVVAALPHWLPRRRCDDVALAAAG